MNILIVFCQSLDQITRGNQRIVLALYDNLKTQNHNVHLISVDDIGIESKNESNRSHLKIRNPLNNRFYRIINKLLNIILIFIPIFNNFLFYILLRKKINKSIKCFTPNIVIYNYLESWPINFGLSGFSKVLFSHDLLFQRIDSKFQTVPSFLRQSYVCFVRFIELFMMRLYNRIFLVSQKEFNTLHNSKILRDCRLLPFLIKPQFNSNCYNGSNKSEKYDFGFIAANNNFNIHAFYRFLDLYQFKLDNASLLLAGGITTNNKLVIYAKKIFSNVQTIKNNDCIDLFYSSIKFSIAPYLAGSGIKIKVVESLSRGVPPLGNEISFEGMQEYVDLVGSNNCIFSLNEIYGCLDNILYMSPQNYQFIRNSAIQYYKKMSNFDDKYLFL